MIGGLLGGGDASDGGGDPMSMLSGMLGGGGALTSISSLLGGDDIVGEIADMLGPWEDFEKDPGGHILKVRDFL